MTTFSVLLLGVLISTYFAISAKRSESLASQRNEDLQRAKDRGEDLLLATQQAKTEAEEARVLANQRAEAEARARKLADEQKQEAQEQRRQAEAEKQRVKEVLQQLTKTSDALDIARLLKEQAQAQADKNLFFYCHRLAAAERELIRGENQQAKTYLEQCPEPLRHWEWDYLDSIGLYPPRDWNWVYLSSLGLHTHNEWEKLYLRPLEWDFRARFEQNLERLAFSPEGSHIVGTRGTELAVWDVKTGRADPSFTDKSLGTECVAFSRDGKYIGLGDQVGDLFVVDAKSGKELRHIWTLLGPLQSIAFSPDGKRIVSGGKNRLKLWELKSAQSLRRIDAPLLDVEQVWFSPDGKCVVAKGARVLQVWDLATGDERKPSSTTRSFFKTLAFSPSGRQAVSRSEGEDSLVVWDVRSSKVIHELSTNDLEAECVAFRRDGKAIVAGFRTGILRVWEAESGRRLLHIDGHPERVTIVGFSPDGQGILSFGLGKTLKVWDLPSGREVRKGHKLWSVPREDSPMSEFGFSTDGRTVAGLREDGSLMLWDATTGRGRWHAPVKANGTECVCFHPEGTKVATGGGSWKTAIVVWDVEKGEGTSHFCGGTQRRRLVSGVQSGWKVHRRWRTRGLGAGLGCDDGPDRPDAPRTATHRHQLGLQP